MEPQARASWVELEVKCGGLSGLLLLAGQPGEAVGEGVCDAEFHRSALADSPSSVFRIPVLLSEP